MKHYLLLIIITCSLVINAQQKKITFEYDPAGNQIKRELTFVTNKETETTVKEISAVKEEDLQKFFPEDTFSYYPNPVREELYLKWQLGDTYIKRLQLSNFNGQTIKTYSQSSSDNSLTIPFQSYPVGVYLIVLEYSNGDQKTIKIIKK